MNLTKFTQKSMQAVQQCEKLAYEYGNQEIEQEHLLYSLLTIDDSLILKLIEKMEIQKEYFTNRVEQGIRKRTKVQGGQIYIGQDLNKVLIGCGGRPGTERCERKCNIGKCFFFLCAG